MRFVLASIVAGCGLGSTGAAQIVQIQAPASGPVSSTEPVRAYSVEKGMPYSGVRVVHRVVFFPDSPPQVTDVREHEWRDSDGRTRRDVTLNGPDGGLITVCNIEDPMEHVRYTWKVEKNGKRVASMAHYKPGVETVVWGEPAYMRKPEVESGRQLVILNPERPDPLETDETLRPEYIDGLYAEGSRSTRTLPPGKESNTTDHEIKVVHEIWMSPDLRMMVKSSIDDPRNFTETTELKNINRSSPDLGVFRPPAGYTVREVPENDPVWSEPIG